MPTLPFPAYTTPHRPTLTHSPLGPRDSWFFGYLSATLRDGVLGTVDKLVAAHGPLFKLRLTCRLFVVVADPDAARCACAAAHGPT